MRKIEGIVEAARASNEIATAYLAWKEPPEGAAGFGPFERREFRFTHVLPSVRLADLYATSSDVASLPTPVRTELIDRIRQLSRGMPHMLHLPARSVVDLCMRLEGIAVPAADEGGSQESG